MHASENVSVAEGGPCNVPCTTHRFGHARVRSRGHCHGCTTLDHFQKGTWCSGITSAPHAEGPGFKSRCVQITRGVGWWCMFRSRCQWRMGDMQCTLQQATLRPCLRENAKRHWGNHQLLAMRRRAHGVVASHPLRMRKALGSNPSVSRSMLKWGWCCMSRKRCQCRMADMERPSQQLMHWPCPRDMQGPLHCPCKSQLCAEGQMV